MITGDCTEAGGLLVKSWKPEDKRDEGKREDVRRGGVGGPGVKDYGGVMEIKT